MKLSSMNFGGFIEQAWTDHGEHSRAVADRLKEVLPQVTQSDQIGSLVPLVTHVFGEHLGAWKEGIDLLERLQGQADTAEDRHNIFRSISALRLAGGLVDHVEDLMNSDQIRVLGVTVSALIGRGELARAENYFRDAMALAKEGLSDEDPAHRSLAVSGNNLAVELEKQTDRDPERTALMVMAARQALQSWLLVGKWPQHQVAHYRLSKSLLQAGMTVEALEEAMSCLALCKSHQAGAYDMFWANEAVASVILISKPSAFVEYLKNMRECVEVLDAADRTYCEARLKELESLQA